MKSLVLDSALICFQLINLKPIKKADHPLKGHVYEYTTLLGLYSE